MSVATTNANNFIVGVLALHENPFDDHTLQQTMNQVVKLTKVEPEHIMVDRGYRGHDHQGSGKVHLAGRIPKIATRAFRKMLKRRSAIEPTIGHLKSDHRMGAKLFEGSRRRSHKCSGECDRLQPAQAPGRSGLRLVFTRPGTRQTQRKTQKPAVSIHFAGTKPQHLFFSDKSVDTHLNKSGIKTYDQSCLGTTS